MLPGLFVIYQYANYKRYRNFIMMTFVNIASVNAFSPLKIILRKL